MAKRTIITIAELENDVADIFGVEYPFFMPKDFGLLELAQINQAGQTLLNLKASNPSYDDIRAADSSITDFVRTVLPTLPAEVLAKLTGADKFNLLKAFTQAVRARNQATNPAPPNPSNTPQITPI